MKNKNAFQTFPLMNGKLPFDVTCSLALDYTCILQETT